MIGTSAPLGMALGSHGTPALASCTTLSNGQVTCTVSTSTGGAVAAILIFYLVVFLVFLVAGIKIVTKAGYSGWWVLCAFIPLLNVVMFLVFAFSNWPILRQLDRNRQPPAYLSGSGWGGGGSGDRGPWGGGPGGGSSASPGPTQTGEGLPTFGQAGGAAPAGPGGTEAGTPATPGAPTAAAGPQPSGQAPPGWYPTPDGRRRYWNGEAWTDHFA